MTIRSVNLGDGFVIGFIGNKMSIKDVDCLMSTFNLKGDVISVNADMFQSNSTLSVFTTLYTYHFKISNNGAYIVSSFKDCKNKESVEDESK